MAAGLPLPKRVFAHGWLLFENDKMSKSRGNIVRATPISDVMGFDALRYFLLREIVFGKDGSFSYDALVGRYNSDLANGLGNLASRTLSMIWQYRKGYIPARAGFNADPIVAAARGYYDNFEFSRALETIWSLVGTLDGLIVAEQPWKLAKQQDDAAQARLDQVLYTAAEALRIITALVYPVMPRSAEKIWQLLGMQKPLAEIRFDDLAWGGLEPGQKVAEVTPVFPRIEAGPAIARMQQLETEETARQNQLLGKKPEAEAAPAVPIAPIADPISIDDFSRVDLRVGEVKHAEAVKGADKLLHLKVDIGEGQPRTIVAGIAKAYKPEQLIGRKVVIVANLEPRKLRGIESQGMIVAASLEGGPAVLAGFHEEIQPGARLK
jgi:methionyl-tRNA synthetase